MPLGRGNWSLSHIIDNKLIAATPSKSISTTQRMRKPRFLVFYVQKCSHYYRYFWYFNKSCRRLSRHYTWHHRHFCKFGHEDSTCYKIVQSLNTVLSTGHLCNFRCTWQLIHHNIPSLTRPLTGIVIPSNHLTFEREASCVFLQQNICGLYTFLN